MQSLPNEPNVQMKKTCELATVLLVRFATNLMLVGSATLVSTHGRKMVKKAINNKNELKRKL